MKCLQKIIMGVLLLSCSALFAESGTPLNVILITVDDLGWTDLSCYGSEYYETPNLDRLARDGVRFTDAYAACSVCSPTRAAILTGRYPARVGITDFIGGAIGFPPGDPRLEKLYPSERGPLLCPPNVNSLPHDEVTLAELFKARDYLTCHIGKWHLGGGNSNSPETHGFDLNIGGVGRGMPPSFFDPYSKDGKNPGIGTLPPRQTGEYLTDRETDEALAFLSQTQGKPFFLNLCHYAVHIPLEAKEEDVARFQAKPGTDRHDNPVYAAMIASVDDALGRIREKLEELGLTENTLIFFTSDNGGYLPAGKQDPLRSGKGSPYEGGLRIPQIVYWPGVTPAGQKFDDPTTSVDILPTLCEIAGLQLPEQRTIDGISLAPLLRAEVERLPERSLFWHFPHYRFGRVKPYSIVRMGDWKLLKRWGDGKPYELYNLAEDLGETLDLADSRPDKVAELEKHLQTWLNQTSARLPKQPQNP